MINMKPIKCNCGSNPTVHGNTLECSNRICGRTVTKKTKAEAITRWNEMNNIKDEQHRKDIHTSN